MQGRPVALPLDGHAGDVLDEHPDLGHLVSVAGGIAVLRGSFTSGLLDAFPVCRGRKEGRKCFI